jgi:hypothetical protein
MGAWSCLAQDMDLQARHVLFFAPMRLALEKEGAEK